MHKPKSRKRICIIFIVFMVFVLICGTVIQIKTNNQKCEERMQAIRQALEQEKKWILKNQGEDGVIYMNGALAGDVNPYFSCQAALGLLAKCSDKEEIQEKEIAERELEIQSVLKYLNWHSEQLLETNGSMGIYRKMGDKPQIVAEADSVDAYLGVYLELLGEYLMTTGSAKGLLWWTEASALAIRKLEELMHDGLTRVSTENDTKYLMDNLEVWRGLTVWEKCMRSYENMGISSSQQDRAVTMRKLLEKKIPEIFWDKENSRWRVMAGDTEIKKDVFYPDGVAQIYPLIVGFPIKNLRIQKRLYRDFTESFQWQELIEEDTNFIWSMVGMSAAEVGDDEGLYRFLKSYERAVSISRKYPLYTGEAGWICREYERAYKNYEKRILCLRIFHSYDKKKNK